MTISALASTARFSVAVDSGFRNALEMNLVKIAQNVYAELNTTPGHAQRAVLATAVLNNPGGYVDRFSFIVASDPAGVNFTAANITDQNMQDAISSTWNAVAGAVLS